MPANANLTRFWCQLFIYAWFIVVVAFMDLIVIVDSSNRVFTTARVVIFLLMFVCLSVSCRDCTQIIVVWILSAVGL